VKEGSGKASSHYSLFEKDFDLAKTLGQNAHRFSMEWSRIEPREGEWNEEAVRHYQKVIETLREKGLEPIVTLHHFTNPTWFLDRGGWANPALLGFFERYVRKAVESCGTGVRYWITINEPLVYLFQGYITGLWPPGEKSFDTALTVCRNMLLGHQLAYRAIHEVSRKKWDARPCVSIATHLVKYTPCGQRPLLDSLSTWLRHRFVNRFPLESLVSGFLFFPGLFFEKLLFKKSLDFIGVNYYRREHIHYAGHQFPGFFGEPCPANHHPTHTGLTEMGWEVYPYGFYEALLSLKRYRLPIMITENGLADSGDRLRWPFIQSHLLELARAMKGGVRVMGYLYWSLLDNFEWSDGFRPRFGLVEVDYRTQERKIRRSARLFAEICLKNRITI